MADNKKKYCGVERTLVVFKPDAVQRGIVGEILQRFERSLVLLQAFSALATRRRLGIRVPIFESSAWSVMAMAS